MGTRPKQGCKFELHSSRSLHPNRNNEIYQTDAGSDSFRGVLGYSKNSKKSMKSSEALMVATAHMKDFMMNQTRREDVQFFLEISRQGAMTRDQLPLSIVVPSFILSELKTAFQMGFLIFIPFIVVDFIVASSLMSMGMMMMPPVVISMPFKLLLFVLVDGWYLIVQSLVESFNVS